MVSVPGIGPVIATELLVATNEMQTINDPKKLACHAGVAPFDRAACAVSFRNKYPRQNQGESSSPKTAKIVDPHGRAAGAVLCRPFR